MKISKEKYAWHYELYEMGVSFTSEVGGSSLNFCQYSRKVLVGAFASLIMVLIGVVLSLLIIEPVASIGLWAFGDHPFMSFFDPDGGGGLIWMLDIILFLFILVGLGVAGWTKGWNYMKFKAREWERSHLDSIAEEEYVPPQPGFFATLYETLKDKVCINVEITK